MTGPGSKESTANRPRAIDPTADRLHVPDRTNPLWSESEWFGVWSPTDGVGLFLHAGVFIEDPDLWWAQTIVYLPGGRLVVDRSFGRSRQRDRLLLQNFALAAEEPFRRWSSAFDGAGELTTSAALTSGIAGAGPAVPVQWTLEAEAAAPAWDMYALHGNPKQHWAGASHTQQTFRTRGTLRVGDEVFRLDGVGYNDHSCGKRSWTQFGGDQFLVAVLPQGSLHAVNVWNPAGKKEITAGACFVDDTQTGVTDFRLPPLEDVSGAPHRFGIDVVLESGVTMALAAEVLHTFSYTVFENNATLNGIDWTAAGDPLLFAECAVRLYDAGGKAIGHGHVERGVRRSALAAATPRS